MLKSLLSGEDKHEFNWPCAFSSYNRESYKVRNQRTLWVGRWPAVTLWPHLIFHASTVCAFSAKRLSKKKKRKRSVLDTVVWDHFSLWSKVGALALREVIFFFHIYPKSPGVLYGWSLKVGEMASRCTLMGISVAEICGIEMTSPDSYSLLTSPLLPAGPRLRPSVWVTPHSEIQRRYCIRSSCSFFSPNMPFVCTIAVFPCTLRLMRGWSKNFLKLSTQRLTLDSIKHAFDDLDGHMGMNYAMTMLKCYLWWGHGGRSNNHITWWELPPPHLYLWWSLMKEVNLELQLRGRCWWTQINVCSSSYGL